MLKYPHMLVVLLLEVLAIREACTSMEVKNSVLQYLPMFY